jgi:hypothetical protein
MVLGWFEKYPVHFRIAASRTSKFGDYRAPLKSTPARISVNKNLNRYNFLITLVHEMAHHQVWADATSVGQYYPSGRRKRFPKPHGPEWKNTYRKLMEPLMTESVFPAEVLFYLRRYFVNPRSSSQSEHQLSTALKAYDEDDGTVLISSLAAETKFMLPGGRKFVKKEKLRTRFRCISLDNRKTYLISPGAKVIPLDAVSSSNALEF